MEHSGARLGRTNRTGRISQPGFHHPNRWKQPILFVPVDGHSIQRFLPRHGDPLAHDLMALYDGEGSISFNIGGNNASPVNDAGTEAETYTTSAANGLFGLAGGQSGPDSPIGSLGLPIANVTGSLPLDALNFVEGSQPNFDFNNANLYPNGIATVTITAIPEPSTGALGLLALGSIVMIRRRRS